MQRYPVIGVTSSHGGGRYMWWFYWIALRLFRMRPVRLVAPILDLDASSFDGFIIGGGDNIGAEIYNGVPVPDVRIDPERDVMELRLMEHCIDRGTPILGVCRGAQMLNASYGGSLHQDMRAIFKQHPDIWSPLPKKRVRLEKGSKISGLMRVQDLSVNSLHRQAIDKLGSGLRISGRDEFGTIQSIEDPKAEFRIGVQWHPEFLIHHRTQRRLFEGFADAVRSSMTPS